MLRDPVFNRPRRIEVLGFRQNFNTRVERVRAQIQNGRAADELLGGHRRGVRVGTRGEVLVLVTALGSEGFENLWRQGGG